MAMRSEMGIDGGPYAVVSTMGVMKYEDASKTMYVEKFFEDLGVSRDEIKRNTGFDIDVSRAEAMAPPNEEELHILRNHVDPEGIYMKY